MKNYFLLSVLIIFTFSNYYGQDFGDVSQDELGMFNFPDAPGEDAVILFDISTIKITRGFNLEITRHKRVKVLTQEGKESANVAFYCWDDDDLDDLDCVCYSPNGDEFELDSDNIFEEIIGDRKKITFAVPGVEIGSVFEFEYTIYSQYLSHLEPWLFQSNYYTKLSQVTVMLQKNFVYNTLKMNIAKYQFNETSEEIRDPSDVNFMIMVYTFTAKDLPGLKKEPFIDNLIDKYAKILFFIQSYRGNRQTYNYARNWTDLATDLAKTYDRYVNASGPQTIFAMRTANSENNDLDKAKKLYDFVRLEVKTTEHTTLWGSNFKEPEKVFEEKQGSLSEKNVLLVNMLKSAGFDAKPVLISTRNHGSVIPAYCDPAQFNRALCLVKIDDKDYFLNTEVKANPFGYLTPDTETGHGLLISSEHGNLIGIRPLHPSNRVEIETEGQVDLDGSIKCSSKLTYKGYAALVERENLDEEKKDDYVKEKIKKLFDNAEIDTFYYEAENKVEEPLVLNVSFTLPDYVESSGNLFYFCYPLFTCEQKNPFVRENRYYSIDFDYEYYSSEQVKIKLPPGLILEELPKSNKVTIPGFSFRKSYSSEENAVKCYRSVNLPQRVLEAIQYPDVKSCFDVMVASDQEQVVLLKVN